MEDCPHYVPRMAALKMCHRCGGMFEVSTNFRGLDYDLCPVCNLHVLEAHG